MRVFLFQMNFDSGRFKYLFEPNKYLFDGELQVNVCFARVIVFIGSNEFLFESIEIFRLNRVNIYLRGSVR